MNHAKYFLTLTLSLPLMGLAQHTITEADGSFTGLGHARSHDFPLDAEIFTIKLGESDTTGYRDVHVEVSVNDLHTGNNMRDAHMRMSLLDRKKHPMILFHSRFMLPELVAGTVEMPGTLTINGIAKDYTFVMDLKSKDGSWHAQGTFKIIPTDFELPLVGMGPMKLQDHVDLELDVTF